MIIQNQKSLFDIPVGTTFLNCAYLSPLLLSVNRSGIDTINKRSHPWKIKADDWISPAEQLRELFATIIHASKENIALIPSVSYGVAIAAKNISLKATQKIIILDQQFPSNVYAWRERSAETGAKLVTVKRKDGQNWTNAILDVIKEDVGVVAIPNCHWTDGSIINLEEISKKVKAFNGKLVVDGSQSVGAFPFDAEKIKPDFLITVGYKWLLGPYGLGYLYVGSDYCDSGKPLEFPWLDKRGSEDFAGLVNYRDEYRAGARRYDAGEVGLTLVPMAIAALTQVLEWGIENIQETLSILTDEIAAHAKRLDLLVPQKSDHVGHLIGIEFPESQITNLTKKLFDNQVFVSFRGSKMRVAPHLYNDSADIQKLFELLG
jgi:selenocysteine lyase/cysteine desulfurase